MAGAHGFEAPVHLLALRLHRRGESLPRGLLIGLKFEFSLDLVEVPIEHRPVRVMPVPLVLRRWPVRRRRRRIGGEAGSGRQRSDDKQRGGGGCADTRGRTRERGHIFSCQKFACAVCTSDWTTQLAAYSPSPPVRLYPNVSQSDAAGRRAARTAPG